MFLRLLILLLLVCPALAQTKTVERLRDVKTVYVDSLGDDDGAKVVREKLIARLIMTKAAIITEEKSEADAIITGLATVTRVEGGGVIATPQILSGGYGTGFQASLTIRLITPDKRTLWADDLKSNSGKSVSSNVAEDAAKHLRKAIEKDRKSK